MESKYQTAFNEYLQTIDLRDQKYYKSLFCGALKIGVKFLLLEKKKVKTEFCFSDEGKEYETFNQVTANEKNKIAYFKAQNLAKFDTKDLHNNYMIQKLQVSYDDNNRVMCYYHDRFQPDSKRYRTREMTDAEIAEYEKGLQFARAEHEKKLDTYLKRNGTSKLRFFTFYADI